ncbi:Neurotrophin-3 [Holothuria leucospilota]|uniref:Neurotrophin-3 n=1 Tax=Holothuria leucospilota TaxID=206669 RepID=A0A9Q1H419_HOLLE|nr:Neurotrophin-3 [Holothuria leucospilota]
MESICGRHRDCLDRKEKYPHIIPIGLTQHRQDTEERRWRIQQMCHRWLFAVIMCIISWHPVYSLPLDVRPYAPISSSHSLEGFPSSTQAPAAVSSSSSFAPNILPAPPGQTPSIHPVPKVQSVNQFQTFSTYFSHRVAFSLTAPPDIPSADDFPTSGEDVDEHGRYKRRVHMPTLRSVCDLEQTWRKKTWAIDILGQNITVLTNITTNGNIKVYQWFYETTCRTHGHCKGIDHSRYDSQCMTKKSWVFAMTRNARGEEGWNWISIDTACNCGFQRKNGLLHDIFDRGTYSDDADLT